MKTETEKLLFYTRCLPVGDIQGRIIRGEEDANLSEILDAFEAALIDRRKRGFGSRMDGSLIDTISICRSRINQTGGNP